jgi:CheY-like chemotaxis protein
MLLTFVQEILSEANYDVTVAATAKEGLHAAREQRPDLILLDYLLPDFRGDEVSRQLHEDEDTTNIPVLYMSGFGADLASAQAQHPNVLAILNKPFSSDILLKAVEQHLGKPPGSAASDFTEEEVTAAIPTEMANVIGPETGERAQGGAEPLWNENAQDEGESIAPAFASSPEGQENGAAPYFAGETSFFPLGRALRIIAREKLTGVLRCSWSKPEIELYAREGKILLVTTRDPDLYCGEAPITLVNVDPESLEKARDVQRRSSAPLFLPLMRDDLILRDPALQLVQHYGQKLFAQLWCAPHVRLAFERRDPLPDFAREIPGEEDVDHWALATLRLIQYPEIADQVECDPSCIPAYTRDGFERVQKLRLSVAEAQFASQFNGNRSIAQIARNLRLDLKFARLTLFRFLALEIVECWPPQSSEKIEPGGLFKRLGRSIGIGE